MQKQFLIIPQLILVLTLSIAKAQCPCNRIESQVEVYSSAGTSSTQGFWVTHNRYGMFDATSPNALLLPSARLNVRNERMFDWGGGVGLLGRAAEESRVYLHEAYLEAKLGFIRLNVGRRAKQPGVPLSELSSGTMFISSNAIPVPRIEASVPDFYEVPFTRGWLEFRGHFSHGWLNDGMYISNPFLHDKSLHVQTGGSTGLKFYWGISHSAIWGGEAEGFGQLPSSFSDFFRVMVARPGAEGSPANEVNALGFHTGNWDWGLRVKVRETGFHLYYQHHFTDASGRTHKNAGDGLFGLNITNPIGTRWITEFTYEYLNTTNQSGPGLTDPMDGDSPDFCEEQNCGFPFGGRDSYYNNSIYRSGHSYYGFSLGNPFFLTQHQLQREFPDAPTFGSTFFISNRNIAHHLGIKGIITSRLSYKLLTSYVKYLGTYSGLNLGQLFGYYNPALQDRLEEYFFNPPREQWYFLLEANWGVKKFDRVNFTTALAVDYGGIFNSTGILLGVAWRLTGSE